MIFKDRHDAGRRLAAKMTESGVQADLVLAIPRGGVPVGSVVAEALDADLDVIEAEKMGAPFNPELAIGAVAAGGSSWLNNDLIRDLGVEPSYVETVRSEKSRLAETRAQRLRGHRPPSSISGRRVAIVDDGIATGATMRACLRQIAKEGAARVILAVPVGPQSTARRFQGEADEIVIAETPFSFSAVGQFYRDFSPTSDNEVIELLERAGRRNRAPGGLP